TAERANRTIVETARSMLHGANLDYSYWGEAVMNAVYIRNRSPSRWLPTGGMKGTHTTGASRLTPFEAWTGNKPSLGHLKVFGCKAYAHIPDQRRTKLDPKAVQCIFVGYAASSKAYRLYDPVARRIIISRDVTFFENQRYTTETTEVEIIGGRGVHASTDNLSSGDGSSSYPVSRIPSNIRPAQVVPQSEMVEEKTDQLNISGDHEGQGGSEGRRSARTRRTPGEWWDVKTHIPQKYWSPDDNQESAMITGTDCVDESLYALFTSGGIEGEPLSYSDAMRRSDAEQWKKAAQEEYASLKAAST
ncbi:MAG: hypothetical protein ACREHG_08020, partial [Candidatus Saccharimonadales bacterium]